MSYYFSSDGSLKYSTKSEASILNSVKSSSNSSSASSTAASTSTGSSGFTTAMKNAAMAKCGKLSSDAKTAARANNADYQRISALQAKVNAIAAQKPRTFDDDDDANADPINLTAIEGYTTAQQTYYSKKSSSSSSSSSGSSSSSSTYKYSGSSSSSSSSSSSKSSKSSSSALPYAYDTSMYKSIMSNSSY